VVAPGVSIISAASDGQKNTFNDGYKTMSGTSMATPLVSAASIIIDQYFREGFYPNGSAGSGPGFQSSGPLRKAVLVASGLDMNGGKYVGGPVPDYAQGWGKVVLANSLYLSGYDRSDRLWVSDYYNDSHVNDGLATGETRSEMVTVNSSRPLKVVLTWNDWPGAGLVNDLNLEVTCPNGTLYRGNQLVNGSSVVSAQADSVNTVEAVMIPRPQLGLYIINVTALTVGNGSRQRYSLLATGDLFDSSVALVRLDRERTGLSSVVGVSLMDRDLRGSGTVTVNATSNTEAGPEPVVLRETGGTGYFSGSLALAPGTPVRDGTLQVHDGDTVRVYYNDPDPPGISWDSCVVDGAPPKVVSVVLDNVTNSTAFLSFDTDELSTVNVPYRTGPSGWELTDAQTSFHHELELAGLAPRTDFSLDIDVADLFGNSQLVDFNGSHLNFRTHDLTYRPAPGNAGWASAGEDQNHFAEEGISAGMVDGRPRLGGMLFDAADFPRDSMVTGAQLRIMVRNTDAAADQSLWMVELLDSDSAGLFDGGRGRPNYTELKDATYLDVLGDQFAPSAAVPGRWQVFTLSPAQCRVLYRSLLDGHAAFRIKGPLAGPDSVLEWYSGRDVGTTFWAPQLVLDLDYPPSIYPWAATRLDMDEGAVDSTSVNCSGIFHDEEPLAYDTPTNFDGSGANLTVTVALDGRVSFRPREYWNGVEDVVLRATDTYGLTAAQTVTVTVRPVNDPPRIVDVNGTAARDGMVFYARQDETFATTVEVQDPDLQFEGERLWYVTNDTLVRFPSPSSPVISFRPQNDDVGTRHVRISVRDSDYEDSLNLTFVIENVNDPPSVSIELPAPGAGYNNETPIHFSAYGSTDPDQRWGDQLNFTWESNNSGPVGFGEELNATLPPGRHVVTLIVRDLDGAFDMATVELTVQPVEPPPPPPPPSHPTDRSGDTRTMLIRAGAVVLIVLAVIIALLLVTPRLRRPAPKEGAPKAGSSRNRPMKKRPRSRHRKRVGGGGEAPAVDEEELGGEGKPIEVEEMGKD
jgi:hypothetical protein